MPGEFLDAPDAHQIAEHYLAECEHAEEYGDERKKWEFIKTIAECCALAVNDRELEKTAYFFYLLGRNTSELRVYDRLEDTLTRHAKEEIEKRRGLIRTNAVRDWLKNEAQQFAIAAWQEDKAQAIRTGEMTQLAWEHIIDYIEAGPEEHKDTFRECLPDGPQGIREWIKEVAPGWGGKRGRPPKIKK